MAPKTESPISKQKQYRDQPVGFYIYSGWRFVALAHINTKKTNRNDFFRKNTSVEESFLDNYWGLI